MKSFFELLQEELDAMYTKPKSIDTSIHEEIERLKAEIKRSNELAEYRLQLLMQMPENKPWVGLTDEERYLGDARSEAEIEYARAIEAKLKEKNGG
jgi:hypothetical protein